MPFFIIIFPIRPFSQHFNEDSWCNLVIVCCLSSAAFCVRLIRADPDYGCSASTSGH